jgi:hypothetical protein
MYFRVNPPFVRPTLLRATLDPDAVRMGFDVGRINKQPLEVGVGYEDFQQALP